MDNSIPDTIICILCRGTISYRDGDKTKFREHMRMEHGVFFDLDFLLASCLMDAEQKAKLARSVPSRESKEEETLTENTNYVKDDQEETSAVSQPQSEAEPPRKKKRGRKKKVTAAVPEPLSSHPPPPPSEEETAYSDVDTTTSSLGAEELSVETLLSEGREGDSERFVCQVEGCGKSYNTKGNRVSHEKKAHGILGPRAAKKQRMSVSAEESPMETVTTAEQQNEVNEVFSEETSASGSFLTDTSLGFEDESEGEEDTSSVFSEEDRKTVGGAGGVDLSSSKYFEKNPKIVNSATVKSLGLFDQVNPNLPEGWKQRYLQVSSKSGVKVPSRHYLSPEMKVLKSGLAVVEYLRIKENYDMDQLKLLSKNLNVPEKKFQSLFSA